MALHELQRRAYLDAIGVDCFVPRLQLPGARPSVQCDMPVQPSGSATALEAIHADQSVSASAAPSTDGRSGAADIRNLLDAETPARQAKSAAKTERPAKLGAAKVVPQFSLSIVRAGQLLIVDDALDGGSDPQAYVRFLQNLLFALCSPSVALSIDSFRWPMARARASHIDQSAAVARETLLAYLQKQLDQAQSQRLLLMGDAARLYVVGESVTSGEWLQVPPLSAKCLVTCSASKALTDSSLKPVLWREMQPLVQVLKPH